MRLEIGDNEHRRRLSPDRSAGCAGVGRSAAELLQSGSPPGAWVMLAVPFEQADAIDDVTHGARHGFGSVRIEARIGTTTWRTSLFPDRRRGSFVMGVSAPCGRPKGSTSATSRTSR